MLHAEAGAMQPHFVDGEVVPEGEVASPQVVTGAFRPSTLADKLRYIERTTLCLTVPINPLGSVSIPSPRTSDQDSGFPFQDRVKPLPPFPGRGFPLTPRVIRSHTTQPMLQGPP
jgi:hypothetical protein